MYLISQNGRLIVNMDNVADICVHCDQVQNYKGDMKPKYWQIDVEYRSSLPAVVVARYGNNEEEKCVKQFEAFKKALLAGEKFFDFGKEVE